MGAPFSMLADVTPAPIDVTTFTATMRRFLSEESYSQNIVVPPKATLQKAKEAKMKQWSNP